MTSVTSGIEACKIAGLEHSYTETANYGRVMKAPEGRMNTNPTLRIAGLLITLLCVSLCACQIAPLPADELADSQAQDARPQPQNQLGLIIENDSELPDTYPEASYEVRFLARGGVPRLHWKLEKGALPPGIKLEEDGLLHGTPGRTGEFDFTVSVTDSNNPPEAVQKGFVLRVLSALILKWKTPAHVSGKRIDGSVEVSNITPDDMDLTFVVLAVAENGRATAIGYQHFNLPRATVDKELPFGETLPRGGYVVNVDVVGEVAPKNQIYRERLQTPSALHVNVGP
jgi:hypothetical protein